MADPKAGFNAPLLTFEESVEFVTSLLGGAITPTIFWLHDDTYEARLTVDPAVAFAALQAKEAAARA